MHAGVDEGMQSINCRSGTQKVAPVGVNELPRVSLCRLSSTIDKYMGAVPCFTPQLDNNENGLAVLTPWMELSRISVAVTLMARLQ